MILNKRRFIIGSVALCCLVCLVLFQRLAVKVNNFYSLPTRFNFDGFAYSSNDLKSIIPNFGSSDLESMLKNYIQAPLGSLSLMQSCENWFQLATKYKRCYVEAINRSTELRVQLMPMLKKCSADGFNKLLNVVSITNTDDKKGFIHIVDKDIDMKACNLVTLGVGGDITAEQKLMELIPHCRLYGADPGLISGQVYAKVGKFFNFAVSDSNTILKSYVMLNGIYSWTNVSTVEFIEFLQKHAKLSMIDHLWMDAEGAEFKLFKYLYHDGLLAKNNIHVCQLTVEVHTPVGPFTGRFGLQYPIDFDKLMTDFFEKSDLIVLWVEIHPLIRIFAVNYADEYCIRKYFRHLCQS